MKDVGQRNAEVAALKHAMPYVRMFRGKTFVVKVSGAAAANDAAARAVVEQLEILLQLGIRVILVHGGGPQASALSRRLGNEPRFEAGRRVTDEAALAATILALNGEVNTRFLAACRGLGLPAVGLSGVDSGVLRARRRPPVVVDGKAVDYGYVGDLIAVEASVLERVLQSGFLPVVSPLSADDQGQVLNVNADTVAAAIAVAMRAEKLLLLTGAPGILERVDDPRSLVAYTDLAGLEAHEARRFDRGRHVAQGRGDRGGDSRRRPAGARGERRHRRRRAARGVHQRRHRHHGGRRSAEAGRGRADLSSPEQEG